MTTDPLLYERRGEAAWLTFNRPRAMNAFNSELYAAFVAALDDASRDRDIRSVVLIGEGGRAFSAGADLKEIADFDARGVNADAEPGTGMGGTQLFENLASFTKPVIAAIDGHCLAGGMEVAALCDIRIATEHSSFGLPEARLSLMPGPGLVELGRLIPLGEALRIQLTARPITARRAFEIGFVQALLPDRSELVREAEQMAADIALGAPLAIEAYKEVVKQGRDLSIDDASRRRDELWDRIQQTDDRIEGPRAFTEKRTPRWTHR
jgi:enoyl-CoA hydratase/carnithine racemase